MPYGDIKKAINWAKQQQVGSTYVYPVQAVITKHNGRPDVTPPTGTVRDQVTYAMGEVEYTEDGGKPHLAGSLTYDYMTSSTTGALKDMSGFRSIKVAIFPDGTISYQDQIGSNPVGGMPPITYQGTDVNDVLVTSAQGGQVMTVGVATMPRSPREPE